MSGDANKDDKGKEKKSLPAKLIAVSLGILAILVFLAISNVTIPETMNQGAQLTTNIGSAGHNLARGIDKGASGISDSIGALLKIAIAGLIAFLIGREVFKMVKGGGHDDHAHSPADKSADKKADAKPDDKKADEKH